MLSIYAYQHSVLSRGYNEELTTNPKQLTTNLRHNLDVHDSFGNSSFHWSYRPCRDTDWLSWHLVCEQTFRCRNRCRRQTTTTRECEHNPHWRTVGMSWILAAGCFGKPHHCMNFAVWSFLFDSVCLLFENDKKEIKKFATMSPKSRTPQKTHIKEAVIAIDVVYSHTHTKPC